MKVSAIIPTFNRRTYLRRAIDSVLEQTIPVDEIIVVDDGSTDGSSDAVELWYGSRVRIVRQENTGVSGARRRGVREAHGDWIAFLDSDDEWTPDRNSRFLDAAQHLATDVAWIFGDLLLVNENCDNATLFAKYGLQMQKSPRVFADSLSVQFPFQFGLLQGSFIRRSVLIELNCFDAGLRHSEDLLAGFQVACKYKFCALPFIVGKYFQTPDLAASSLAVTEVSSPDYHRARMLAFSLVVESGRKYPWNSRYADEVRGFCKAVARTGPVSRKLAFQQFKYGPFSVKGLAFLCAVMLGRNGILAWNILSDSQLFLQGTSESWKDRLRGAPGVEARGK
jgi:glycosyltransferase involved in cell wall biosynthesis